jgi:hypothetical protein
MQHYVIKTAAGEIVRIEQLTDAPDNLEPGEIATLLPSGQTPAQVMRASRPLAQIKAERVQKIKAARDAAIYGTFRWDGSEFDADQVSQTRILGLKMASADVNYTPIGWRLTDNSWRQLSAADAGGDVDAAGGRRRVRARELPSV